MYSIRFHCFICTLIVASSAVQNINIRGNLRPELLPTALTNSWTTWTCNENNNLEIVENDSNDGWLNPCSYEELFLPSDIPLPSCSPALGVVVSNGLLRYVMPSVVLTLETPDKKWRNRGLATLPRAHSWIDLYASQIPIQKLR